MRATTAQLIRLGVNIDHVATLRQARGTFYPDPVQAAQIAEVAGADGITLHLREDRRHIQDRDLQRLLEVAQIPVNLEMAITAEMLEIACHLKPEKVCLVPEKRAELTTEGGLDVVAQERTVLQACQQLTANGIEVSLFIDAEIDQISAARSAGVPVIELHTGPYAEAKGEAQERELSRLHSGVQAASEMGLKVNAGHGLHYHNVQPVAAIKEIEELNIGHGIIAHALWVGFAEAIREMKQLMFQARQI